MKRTRRAFMKQVGAWLAAAGVASKVSEGVEENLGHLEGEAVEVVSSGTQADMTLLELARKKKSDEVVAEVLSENNEVLGPFDEERLILHPGCYGFTWDQNKWYSVVSEEELVWYEFPERIRRAYDNSELQRARLYWRRVFGSPVPEATVVDIGKHIVPTEDGKYRHWAYVTEFSIKGE